MILILLFTILNTDASFHQTRVTLKLLQWFYLNMNTATCSSNYIIAFLWVMLLMLLHQQDPTMQKRKMNHCLAQYSEVPPLLQIQHGFTMFKTKLWILLHRKNKELCENCFVNFTILSLRFITKWIQNMHNSLIYIYRERRRRLTAKIKATQREIRATVRCGEARDAKKVQQTVHTWGTRHC